MMKVGEHLGEHVGEQVGDADGAGQVWPAFLASEVLHLIYYFNNLFSESLKVMLENI